ncbi:ABC transporter permease [Azospirillum canadense]|uniref:ABC transporter permease n=1 Tax=Azospirillum canadense TaxID=403962 RepID=UPI002225FD8D|nr:ABC transporter permease [Azospirillum canadense]MCW2236629.1 NitT/TauT family transport system permease protein [Azospirillum canadense]
MRQPLKLHTSVALSALGVAVFLLAWEALARSGVVPSGLLPSPSAVPAAFVAEVRAGTWQAMVLASLSHYLSGLFLGTVLGIAFGTAAAMWGVWDAAQAWVVRMLRPIPSIAWIPFAIIWFGVSESAATFLIALTVFWINYYASYAAVRGVDKDLIELGYAFGQGGLIPRLFKIVLPGALPGILSGVRAGLGQGWMTVVAAELFGIAGLGSRMSDASGLLATNIVVLYMVTIAALYGVCDFLFMQVQQRVLAWQK